MGDFPSVSRSWLWARAGQGLDLTGCAHLLSEGEAYLHQKKPIYEAGGCVAKLKTMKDANIIPPAL